MGDFLYQISLILIVILGVTIAVFRVRKNLLKLWKDVSHKEIVFHRLLSETIKMFYAQKDLLKNEDNRVGFIHLGRSRRKKIRYLLLSERQDLFKHIQDIYAQIEEMDNEELQPLRKQYKKLQQSRRVYNSRVLIYNQQINTFPIKNLAVRMNLKLKEYFGWKHCENTVFFYVN